MTEERERREPLAMAIARILAVADLGLYELPEPLADVIEQARAALAVRDHPYNASVLIVGPTPADATAWLASNEIDGGATMWTVDGTDLTSYPPPFTVVVLPGTDRRDDWPQIAAQLAIVGNAVDVIRIRDQKTRFPA